MTDGMDGRVSAVTSRASRERDFLVEVAWLRHEFGLSQDQIAGRKGVSRSTISRALAQAEALGIVQIVVTEPLPGSTRLADALRRRYGIAAHVGVSIGAEDAQLTAACLAARLIERAAMTPRTVIAASWGRTLAQAASLVRHRRTSDVVVVDAVGHASGGALAPAVEVTRRLSAALGGSSVHVPSPAFADSAASLRFLLESQPVQQALGVARAADLTLVSVGLVGDKSLLRQAGLMSATLMDAAVARGAVGEMLGSYYDAAGREVMIPGLYPVALTLGDLRAARRAVAVAAGPEKGPPLSGALAGRLLAEIVVDESLAQALLDRS
jgi:DNA-binding transcriptional regulator LsrR (DeoR family)